MKDKTNFEAINTELGGTFTIQLFDENEKMIQEVKGHNCVNKGLFSSAYINFIFNGTVNNNCLYNTLYENYSNSSTDNAGLMRWLYLTNAPYAQAEDECNPLILGETIGYANCIDGSNSSSTLRGVNNTKETKTYYNRVPNGSKILSKTQHFVWDFGTDKANGTFDNLYLRCNDSLNSTTKVSDSSINEYRTHTRHFFSFLPDSKKELPSSTSSIVYYDGGSMSHDNKNLYMQNFTLSLNNPGTSSTPSKCYDTVTRIGFDKWDTQYITLAVPTDCASKQAYIVQGGGYFWRITQDYSCTRYDLDGNYIDTINLASSFSGTVVNISNWNNSVLKNIFFTGDNDHIFIAYKNSSNNNTYNLVVFNSEGQKVSEIQTDQTSIPKLGIYYICDKEYLVTGEDVMYEIKEDGSLGERIIEPSVNNGCVNFYSKEGLLFKLNCPDSSYKYGFDKLKVCNYIPWTTHIKLDAPITKTSSNTMKIKYDFTAQFLNGLGYELYDK